jgi:hypothetical protein
MDQNQQSQQGGPSGVNAEKIGRLVQMYNQNPGAWNPSQVKSLYQAATSVGIPMDIPGSAGRFLGSAAGGFLHGATFGLVPSDAFATPMTPTDEKLQGVGSMLGGLATGTVAGKFAVNSARSIGSEMLAKGLAERVTAKAAGAEAASAVANAGADAGSFTNKLSGMFSKAFSSDKMIDLLQRVKDSPGLQKTINDAIMGGVMGATPNLLSDPGEALTQGLVGAAMGGAYGGYQAKREGLAFGPAVSEEAAVKAGAQAEQQALSAGAPQGEATVAGQKEAARVRAQATQAATQAEAEKQAAQQRPSSGTPPPDVAPPSAAPAPPAPVQTAPPSAPTPPHGPSLPSEPTPPAASRMMKNTLVTKYGFTPEQVSAMSDKDIFDAIQKGQKAGSGAKVVHSAPPGPPPTEPPWPGKDGMYREEPTAIPANAKTAPLSSKVRQLSLPEAVENHEQFLSGKNKTTIKQIALSAQKPAVQKALLRLWAAKRQFGDNTPTKVNTMAQQLKVSL